jgi:hypothetical protein
VALIVFSQCNLQALEHPQLRNLMTFLSLLLPEVGSLSGLEETHLCGSEPLEGRSAVGASEVGVAGASPKPEAASASGGRISALATIRRRLLLPFLRLAEDLLTSEEVRDGATAAASKGHTWSDVPSSSSLPMSSPSLSSRWPGPNRGLPPKGLGPLLEVWGCPKLATLLPPIHSDSYPSPSKAIPAVVCMVAFEERKAAGGPGFSPDGGRESAEGGCQGAVGFIRGTLPSLLSWGRICHESVRMAF